MELTENILWLLKQAFYFSLTTVNDAISMHGVSTAQIGVLRQLANEPGLSGAELARRLLISPQGVQLALTALERRGLVERKQDPQHKRILQAYLTDRGPRRRGRRSSAMRWPLTKRCSAYSAPTSRRPCANCWAGWSKRAPATSLTQRDISST